MPQHSMRLNEDGFADPTLSTVPIKDAGLDISDLMAFEHFRNAVLKTQNAGPALARVPSVAVIIPARNEGQTIAEVVADFRLALPEARIVVYDNASNDDTAMRATIAGAEIYRENRLGKGHVVRRMFLDVDADVYLMVDGDGTYEATAARKLIDMIVVDRLDMAVGARRPVGGNVQRAGHSFGNQLFNILYRYMFGGEFGDIFSGYRAFSHRFVKSFPALSCGFEIETELAVHASQIKVATGEISLPYTTRIDGSVSKLRTVRDGLRILKTFLALLKETRPALFFGVPAIICAMAAVIFAIPLAETFARTGLVPRMPTAILCTGLAIVSCMLGTCGLILDSLARARVEQKRILFLAIAANRR